ncbi:high affinity cationic amino acid transporter 1 [Nematostella vectensis]|uniref:high affinity cationic amino acid transporter 1 n=1 Tax=Nematostella vectensis TaxID=45351 RepID=UPI0020778E42|nr:high affinity cationic amino acid transporter 1 [Nematostella vectensis]
MACARVCHRLTRRRAKVDITGESQFVRCLSTIDLTSIGIGTVVGAGLYVVTGQLARDVAGPAVILSFAFAAVSALLSGICYAEFGCRIPKAGSAYVYTYVCLGEIWAFIVGWNMILEYIIAAASLSRACSEYINSLSGGKIYQFFIHKIGSWKHPGVARFPDFLAVFLAVLITIIVSSGTRQASILNKAVTFVNLSVVVFVICVGFYFADTSNWSTLEKFAPYGYEGVIAAAGSCFFAFVGFDVIGTAGEETKNPKKAIPLALMLTILVSFLAYFGVSTVLTLMVPSHTLNEFAPLAEAFAQKGFGLAKIIISVGAIFATIGCLLSVSFAAPRVVCSMADDGLLFRWLAKINGITHVPVRAVLACSIVVAALTLIMELKQLVEMLSIGTLVAYTMVAIAVLLTRYQCNVESVYFDLNQDNEEANKETFCGSICRCFRKSDDQYKLITEEEEEEEKPLPDPAEDTPKKMIPTYESSFHATLVTLVLTVAIATLSIMLTAGRNALAAYQSWAVLCLCASCIVIVVAMVCFYKLPRNSATFPFTVPCVPLIPVMTIFSNTLLMVSLNHWTYVRFAVWMSLGALIYMFYGYWHSSLDSDQGEVMESGDDIAD